MNDYATDIALIVLRDRDNKLLERLGVDISAQARDESAMIALSTSTAFAAYAALIEAVDRGPIR